MEDITGSAEKEPESQFPWSGNGFHVGICMCLLLADFKGSGRQMKSSKSKSKMRPHALLRNVMSMNCLSRWTRSDIWFLCLLACDVCMYTQMKWQLSSAPIVAGQQPIKPLTARSVSIITSRTSHSSTTDCLVQSNLCIDDVKPKPIHITLLPL